MRGYVPGIIGDVAALHGRYYAAEWGFSPAFEMDVAAGLATFFREYDESRDVALSVVEDGATAGFVAIWGHRELANEARLRWFIVAPGRQGRGIGRALLEAALEHCRAVGYARVELFTFSRLAAARHLYRAHGFTLLDARDHDGWGASIVFERFELLL